MYFHLISAVAALGGLLFGYDTGVISGALLFIRQVMSLSPTLQGVVVAIALGGRRDRGRDGRLPLGPHGPPPRHPDRRLAVHRRRHRLRHRPGSDHPADRPIPRWAGHRRRIDAHAALPRRDLARERPRRDRVAEPTVHHRRHPGVLPGRFRARQRIRRVALDGRSRRSARHHPVARHAGPAGKPALARWSQPDPRRRIRPSAPARYRQHIR